MITRRQLFTRVFGLAAVTAGVAPIVRAERPAYYGEPGNEYFSMAGGDWVDQLHKPAARGTVERWMPMNQRWLEFTRGTW